MRYVDVRLEPDRGWFHRMDELIDQEPEVTREAIHQMNLLNDGTATMLYEFAGSEARVEELLDRYAGAIVYQTSELGDNTLVYAHIEPSDLVQELLAIPQEYGVVVDPPMVFTTDGALRCTLIGDEDAIQEVMPTIPDSVRSTVEKTGEYHPSTERLYAELTDRQQEILGVAIEMGYYDEPRQVTYEDIADEIDCTATTVGEHLRKVEARVMTDIVP